MASTEQAAANSQKLGVLASEANESAEARYQQAANVWRAKLNAMGSKERFKRMANDVVSFDEELSQGADLFGSSSHRPDRMLQSFRKHIVDERKPKVCCNPVRAFTITGLFSFQRNTDLVAEVDSVPNSVPCENWVLVLQRNLSLFSCLLGTQRSDR